jgi:hypothetical protein
VHDRANFSMTASHEFHALRITGDTDISDTLYVPQVAHLVSIRGSAANCVSALRRLMWDPPAMVERSVAIPSRVCEPQHMPEMITQQTCANWLRQLPETGRPPNAGWGQLLPVSRRARVAARETYSVYQEDRQAALGRDESVEAVRPPAALRDQQQTHPL